MVETPEPELDERSVLIKVKVVQPSVTDTVVLKGEGTSQSSRRIKGWLAEGKIVQRGHEYCGEVVFEFREGH